MRQTIGPFILLLVASAVVADEKDDAKKLNGTYTVVELIRDGKPDNSKKSENVTFTIKDGVITIDEGTGKTETAKFTVDASKKPAQIDIHPEKGDKEVVKGIYELKDTDKGAELTLAFGRNEAERPKDFKGEGKDAGVLKLLRKKDK